MILVLVSAEEGWTGELATFVLKLSFPMRIRLVSLFFKITGVIATLAGWIIRERLTAHCVQDVLRR